MGNVTGDTAIAFLPRIDKKFCWFSTCRVSWVQLYVDSWHKVTYVTGPAGGAGTALAQSRETSVTLEQHLINIPSEYDSFIRHVVATKVYLHSTEDRPLAENCMLFDSRAQTKEAHMSFASLLCIIPTGAPWRLMLLHYYETAWNWHRTTTFHYMQANAASMKKSNENIH
jgi:hypothetical protein